MGPRWRAGLFRAATVPFAVACALSLLLAACGGGGGGGGEATVTLTGTALVPPATASPKAGDPGSLEKDQPFTGSRVVAISLRDGRMFPGPQGAAVDSSGRFSISGCPKGHRFLIRAWKGARSVERITHRADDDDGDGVHEDGPVDTASTAACIRLGSKVADRMGGEVRLVQ